jgi:undecaprenyl pyrophosphate phosphatase UppP
MAFLELLKAVFQGILQGITEWLPISSTGHILLLDAVWPMQVSASFFDVFKVVIQLGSILAVVVLYFHKLNPFSPKKDAAQKKGTWVLWAKVLVASIPAAIAGLLLDDIIDEKLSVPVVIATALIVYGIGFIRIGLCVHSLFQRRISCRNQCGSRFVVLCFHAVSRRDHAVVEFPLAAECHGIERRNP